MAVGFQLQDMPALNDLCFALICVALLCCFLLLCLVSTRNRCDSRHKHERRRRRRRRSRRRLRVVVCSLGLSRIESRAGTCAQHLSRGRFALMAVVDIVTVLAASAGLAAANSVALAAAAVAALVEVVVDVEMSQLLQQSQQLLH